jgi:hypothetical protein
MFYKTFAFKWFRVYFDLALAAPRFALTVYGFSSRGNKFGILVIVF